ncbi:hypothetical protein [Microtetraspora malaysiensis]|uniref:hypothetical protein n=1 Tax=Microtetraspora malaysiensis TaxID=161358 RepID=UPI003D8A8AF5
MRSVPASLVATAVAMLLGAWLLGAGYRSEWHEMAVSERTSFDPTYACLQSASLAQLLIGALGVLTVTGEYETGLTRATFTATPQRGQVLALRAALFATVVLLLGATVSFAAFAVGQSQFTGPVPHATLGQTGVLRAVLGVGLYLMLIAVFGMGLGVLTRSTTLALTALFGILLIVPSVVTMLPGRGAEGTLPYLPAVAGSQVLHVVRGGNSLGPWQGTALLALYVAATGAAALVMLRRRDV